jgi:hypothetical protein
MTPAHRSLRWRPRRNLCAALATLAMPAALAQAQDIDGANMVQDIERGYALARVCDKHLEQGAMDFDGCIAQQARNLPPKARVQRQAYFFHAWLRADTTTAVSPDEANVLRATYSSRLAEEKGKGTIPVKLMCRLARAECTGVEQRLSLARR